MRTVSFIAAAFVGGSIRASVFAYFGNALVDSSWMGLVYAVGLFAVAVAIPLAFPSGRSWLRQAFAPVQAGQGEGPDREGSIGQ